MEEEQAAAKARKPDPRWRGFALAWRVAFAAAFCALLFMWRLDIDSAWLVGLALLYVLHRVPRTIRRFRARDPLSAAPWLMMVIGTVGALVYQHWAQGEARERFRTLAAAIEREPCRAEALLPGRAIHAGLLEYPLRVRRDEHGGTLTIALHVNIDLVEIRQVKLPNCGPARRS